MAQTPPPPPLYVSAPPSAPRSAVEAILPAWQNTKRILFENFSVRRWLKLALIAFLAGVIGGGGSGGFNFPGPGGSPGSSQGGGPDLQEAWQQILSWCQAHVQEIIIGVAVLGGLGLILALLWTYISSVFRFIFLESVVTGETAIRASWHRNKGQGFSFFLWRLGFGMVASLVIALVVGLPILFLVIFLSATTEHAPSVKVIFGSIGLLLVIVFLILIAGIILGLVRALTCDFVLPLMYLNRIGVIEGWSRFWELLWDNKVGFLVYFLMKILITVVLGLVSLILGCCGLLVAFLPIAALGAVGYFIVQAAGITSWSWTYLWAIIPVGLVTVIGLGYWMTCVLLPVPVYYQSYALKYLGYVEPTAATI
ncbi:MAG: DUF7544 domain-containing protein [Candidatus Zipacnadales bacterium]